MRQFTVIAEFAVGDSVCVKRNPERIGKVLHVKWYWSKGDAPGRASFGVEFPAQDQTKAWPTDLYYYSADALEMARASEALAGTGGEEKR